MFVCIGIWVCMRVLGLEGGGHDMGKVLVAVLCMEHDGRLIVFKLVFI